MRKDMARRPVRDFTTARSVALSAATCLLAACLLAAGLLAPVQVDAAPLCLSQPTRSHAIEVTLTFEEATIDRSLSKADLTARMGQGAGRQVHGLHSHGLGLSYRIQPAALPKDEGYCFWLESVELEITYAAPTIFVASEHRPNGCNDQAIRQHEAEHERVARNTFDYYRPRFADLLARARLPHPSAPVWTEDPQAKTEEVLAEVQALVEPEVEKLRSLMNERQARVDSPTNYRLTQQRCPNW